MVTEKSTQLIEKNTYMFQVHPEATKTQIETLLKKMYQVEISQIRILNRKGKKKRVGRRMVSIERPDKRVAYVTVSKGTINVIPKA